MKKLMVVFTAFLTLGVVANETQDVKIAAEKNEDHALWRIMVGGFGRGNIRTSMGSNAADYDTLWGPEMELNWNAYESDDFRLWLGIGGAFAPRREVYGRRNTSQTSEHQVSDDGYVTYDFNFSSTDASCVDLASGEFRLVATPEWKICESFSVGARLGVAFDWLQAKCKSTTSWAWNSRLQTIIPGILEEEELDSDSGYDGSSVSKTEFAAYGILGLETVYMFSENVGFYALCDWRIGDDVEFKCAGETCKVDMSGWYAAFGVVVEF